MHKHLPKKWWFWNKIIGLLACISLFLLACNEAPLVPIAPIGSFTNGVIITNEGAFNQGNASISFLNNETKNVHPKIFETINGTPLGDVLQSMAIFEDLAYLVVNNSSKIEVVRTSDFERIRTIEPLTSPRHFYPIDNSTAYVSDIYDNAIAVIDLNTGKKIRSIPFVGWSEGMVKIENEVFVTRPSFFNKKISDQLFVINTLSHSITDSIQVGFNPVALKVDRNKQIWVLCNGEFQDNKQLGGIYKINPSSKAVSLALAFEDSQTSFAPRLAMNGAKDQLFFLKLDVFSMSINDNVLPSTPLIAANGRDLYAIGIHPSSNEIYLGDSGNFVQQGLVTIHDENGQEMESFTAGVGVNGFYFR